MKQLKKLIVHVSSFNLLMKQLDFNMPLRAFVAAGGKNWSLQIGRDRLSWGSGCGGYLKPLGNDPENDLKIRRAGAEATNAKLAQRRSFKEEVDILLSKTDKKTGKTGLESITLAQYERALTGDTKAYQALRDTAGEKPAETIDLSADIMTDEDRKLMERINKRLGE